MDIISSHSVLPATYKIGIITSFLWMKKLGIRKGRSFPQAYTTLYFLRYVGSKTMIESKFALLCYRRKLNKSWLIFFLYNIL